MQNHLKLKIHRDLFSQQSLYHERDTFLELKSLKLVKQNHLSEPNILKHYSGYVYYNILINLTISNTFLLFQKKKKII